MICYHPLWKVKENLACHFHVSSLVPALNTVPDTVQLSAHADGTERVFTQPKTVFIHFFEDECYRQLQVRELRVDVAQKIRS